MRFFGTSDVGVVRSENQDRFGIYELLPGVTLCVVCDGMGGNAGGSIAASIALEAFADMMREMLIPDSPDDKAVINDRTVRDAFRAAVYAANSKVYNKALDSDGKLTGMGTTLVALLLTESGGGWYVNVGDSRLYRVLPDGAAALTKDHSYVRELVELGRMTPEEAKHSSMRNFITRAVGTEPAVESDIASVDVAPCSGHRGLFILCSDGLHGCVEESEITSIVYSARNLHEIGSKLVERARQAGGPDNITVIIAEPD